MTSSRIPTMLALATMLVACSESSTTEPQMKQQFDLCIDCYQQTFTLYPTADIHLGGSPVIAFVVSGVGSLPKNSVATVSLLGTSDTIPAPAPPGPVQSIWARAGATPFRSILQSYAAAGLVAPSDTIPAPPAPGMGSPIRVMSNGDVLVWLSTSYLQQKGLSPSTQSIGLTLSSGKTTLYSAVTPVTVYAK